MMLSSVDFAKYILIRTKERGITPNVTQLLKFLYICDGMMLAYGVNAIAERARAWNYGPVYPKVHKWYRNTRGSDMELSPAIVEYINKHNYDKIVTSMLDTFGTWSAGQLSDWTHAPGSPWEIALERNGGVMNAVISKKDMGKYFREMMNV